VKKRLRTPWPNRRTGWNWGVRAFYNIQEHTTRNRVETQSRSSEARTLGRMGIAAKRFRERFSWCRCNSHDLVRRLSVRSSLRMKHVYNQWHGREKVASEQLMHVTGGIRRACCDLTATVIFPTIEHDSNFLWTGERERYV